MLDQYIARTLRWIDAHAVVGYDRARLRWDSKLFCDILEDSSEWGVLWHRNHFKGEFRVGSQDNFERHLGASGRGLGAAADAAGHNAY